MSLKQYDMEGGTNGTAATVALTGALLLSNPSSQGTITFQSAAKNSGALGLELVAGTTQDLTTRWGADAQHNKMSLAFNFRVNTMPTTQQLLATLRHSSGVAWRLSLRQDRTLHIDGSSVTGDTAVGVAITVGKWHRIEAVVDVGAGTAKVQVFNGNGTTEIAPQLNKSGMSLGTNPIVAADIFCTKNTAIDIDDVRLLENTTAFLGPPLPTGDPSNSSRPWDVVENPGEYVVVGTSSYATALADESDATYVDSVASPNGASFTAAMNPLTLGPVTVALRHQNTTSGTPITRKVELMQGSVVIATRTFTLPTTLSNYSFTTTTGETAAITSPRNNLYVRITDTAG